MQLGAQPADGQLDCMAPVLTLDSAYCCQLNLCYIRSCGFCEQRTGPKFTETEVDQAPRTPRHNRAPIQLQITKSKHLHSGRGNTSSGRYFGWLQRFHETLSTALAYHALVKRFFESPWPTLMKWTSRSPTAGSAVIGGGTTLGPR